MSREIDCLIAEHVFGYSGEEYYLLDPPYISSIADAWKVVEKMREQIFSKRQRFCKELQAAVSNGKFEDRYLIHPDEVPLWITPEAICQAALKTLGVESPNTVETVK